jgi:hypothetical protein
MPVRGFHMTFKCEDGIHLSRININHLNIAGGISLPRQCLGSKEEDERENVK